MRKNVVPVPMQFGLQVTRSRSRKNPHYANAANNLQILPRLRSHKLTLSSQLFLDKSTKSDKNSIFTRQGMSMRWLNDKFCKRNSKSIVKVRVLRPRSNTGAPSTSTITTQAVLHFSTLPVEANMKVHILNKGGSRARILLPGIPRHGCRRKGPGGLENRMTSKVY
jgi:hypothetical protein